MKRILVVLTILLFPSFALAQDNIDIGHIIGGGKMHGAKTADNQTTVGVIGLDANSDTVIGLLSSSKAVVMKDVAGTPFAKMDVNGSVPAAQPAVITPMTALTPVAGAALSARVSLMATASPTLAIVMLPAATSNANKSFGVYNKGASPLLFHNSGVVGTDSINALGAGTPYSCATAKFCDCRVIGTGTYMCVSQ